MFPLLILQPTGGICNRLRAMVSAQALAEACGSSLHVLWFQDQHLGARFEDLFVRPRDVASVLNLSSERLFRVLNAAVCNLIGRRLEQSDVERLNREHGDYVQFAAGRNVFIRTYSRFHCESDFSRIQPRPEILAEVESYTLHQLNAVGVHLRRSDNTTSIVHSPTELFIEAMQAELMKNPETAFFVATDSPEDEQLLMRTFPGRIIIHPKSSLDRREPGAIREAMVDLYCLARCRKLLGSYWSSFTDTAAAIGNVPLQIIRRESPG